MKKHIIGKILQIFNFMRKILLPLVLSIFFIQCSTNNDLEEEEQQEKLEDLAISITVEGNLLNENRAKILYISSEEGKIEGKISLQNNQENLLTIQREPNTKYFAILQDILVYDDRTRHDFSIFENIESSEYTIKANTNNSGANGDLPTVDLYLQNTGSLTQIGRTGGGHATYSSANGGTFKSRGTGLSNPGNYYASFIKQGELFARFFWTEDLEEDKSFSLNYDELPIAPLVKTQFPEHESATVFIHGYRSEFPSAAHILGFGNTQGISTYESYIPEETIFDYISFNARFTRGTKSYSTYSVSEVIPSSIQVPSFDFTIHNFSIDFTNYTTTGNFDISNANFVTSDDDVNIQVLVKVYSEHNNTVSFSIGTLINSLFEDFPLLDATQLEPFNITLTSYNYRENYGEAVKGLIEVNSYTLSPGNLEESVSQKQN